MGAELGRISGPLLSADLLRNGVDLAFETDLLYLAVQELANPSKSVGVGINTDSPSRSLTVAGLTSTIDLLVDNTATISNFYINTNRIQSLFDPITISPNQTTDPQVITTQIGTDNLRIRDKVVENITLNSDINLTANGLGKVTFTTTKVDIDGNLHATGDITLDGNIIFGSNTEDSVTFNSDIASNIVPNQSITYDLGSDTKRWNDVYVETLDLNHLEAPNLTVNDINLLLTQGNTYYVSINGNDGYVGDHLHNTFRTIKHALSQATAGDTVVIFPGTYDELFPLTVPAGVTVNGAGIRSVTVKPTVETNTNNAFLLNGETTISNLTVTDFYSGYAFSFAPGITVTSRSPYIQNVSVITTPPPTESPAISAGNGALVDGSLANSNSREASMLFHSVTFIVPNAKGVVATNKARVEWLNSFTYFAETGIRLETGLTGFAGIGQTKVTISGVTGPVAVGDTFTYASNDGQTVIATGTVSAINGNEYSLEGFVDHLATADEIQPTEFTSTTGAVLSTGKFKFGTASLLLTGANYISSPDSFKYYFADNDFCIECWVYPTAFPSSDATIIGQWGTTSIEQSFNVQLTSIGGIKLSVNDSQNTEVDTGIQYLLTEDGEILLDESNNPIVSENPVIELNAWQHVAVVRHNDDIVVYVNGQEKVSTTLITDAVIADATGDVTIGNSTPSTVYFIGYIDEVRISNGTPRFTTAFTPPTSQYNSDDDTVLLLHFDGVNDSQLFVDNNDVIQNIVFTNATARAIDALDYRDFAAEIRSINSANVYGTYGAVADGRDTLGYLVGHNFGYIGSGTNSDNDQSLVIQANEVVENNFGTIYFDSVDHKGDYRVGDIFYVNQQTGQVTFDAQALDFSATGNIVLEGPTSTTIINAQYIQTGNLKIYNNNIDSLSSSVNVSAFNNLLTLNTDVSVTGSLEITNNLTVAGNIFLGDNPLDTIAIVSNLTQSILPNINNLDIGSVDDQWNVLYAENIAGSLQISNAEISILTSNVDLQLIADGAGSVIIESSLEVTEDLTINGYLEVLGESSFKILEIDGLTSITGNIDQSSGNLDLTGNLSSTNLEITGDSYFYAPDIKIYNNVISVESTDENLIITANGTGSVVFDSALKISNSVISNVVAGAVSDIDKSIVLQPNGTGNVEIDSNKSLVIPAGSSTNRVMVSNGEIRFNTQYNSYEGFSNTGAVSFNNITDLDRNTTITAEPTIGADTDTIRFTINSVVRSFVDSTKLSSNSITVDTITLTNNTISSSSNLEFINSNTGSTVINGIEVKDDSITNTEDSALTIASTPNSAGAGYVKFSGTGAVVFPYGPTEDRRANPELAELRYNSTLRYMEIYSGTGWIPAVGTEGPASADEIEDILNIYALIMG